MCGIAGFWFDVPAANAMETLRAMTERLWHRGPDAGDAWFDRDSGVGLGHRRLAIVELSPAGAQPMRSASGRYTIVFNGEIYNFERLRLELGKEAGAYRGHSDTEVMLAAFESWGVSAAVQKFVGMFAFALWDHQEQKLILGRDRLGKKPLYYGLVGRSLLFASELKAFKPFPGWRPEIDRGSIADLLRYSYIPGPRSIYAGIHKLPPGALLEVRRSTDGIQVAHPVPYWSIQRQSAVAAERPFTGDFNEGVDQLQALMQDAVDLRCIADVPLGAFLSGGVDSSLVVALMQRQSMRPVRTFSIGFLAEDMDEARHAKAVAAYLGTDHTELYVDAKAALDLVPRLPDIYDEPFADSSQIPTALLCAMARRDVTVALSGDGGDEGFCGYERYLLWRRIWSLLARYPRSLINVAAGTAGMVPTGAIDAVFRALSPALPSWVPRHSAGERLHRLAGLARLHSPSALYRQLLSHWTEPESVVIGGRELPPTDLARLDLVDPSAYMRHMTLIDTQAYLPDDILVKVDRASMASSLEVRAPMLDHRVLEFSWTLPVEFLVSGGRGKRILWELLLRHVPRELVDRPKQGFGVPLDEWLRGPLREWAQALLEPSRLRREGYFDPVVISRYWEQHQAGTHPRHYYLWDVLMFQAWLERESVA